MDKNLDLAEDGEALDGLVVIGNYIHHRVRILSQIGFNPSSLHFVITKAKRQRTELASLKNTHTLITQMNSNRSKSQVCTKHCDHDFHDCEPLLLLVLFVANYTIPQIRIKVWRTYLILPQFVNFGQINEPNDVLYTLTC